MRIEEALGKFIVQLRADGRSEHTIGQYRRHVRLLASWLDQEGHSDELEDIEHELLAAFLNSDAARVRPDGKRKLEASANAMRTSLRCFFRYCHDAGWTGLNPARLVRRARCGAPPPRALSEDEQRRLLAELDQAEGFAEERDRVLFSLLLRVGLRIGSALALRVEDVDLDAGELWLCRTKGDRREKVFIPRDVVPLLRAWVERVGDGWLFAGYDDQPIGVRHADRRFRIWAERAGLRAGASPHALRHSFATGLLRRTGDLSLVQAALRHRSILSTTIYARCDDDRLRAAVGA